MVGRGALEGTGNTRTSGPVYNAQTVEEMRAYDLLPRNVRHALAKAPGAFSAKETRELLAQYPAFVVMGALLDSCREEYGVSEDRTALLPPRRARQRKRQSLARWRGP